MCRVEVRQNGNTTVLFCNSGEKLSDVLIKNGIEASHPCAGKGICGKCRVIVGEEIVLSCKYKVEADIIVVLPEESSIESVVGADETGNVTGNVCLVLDIGTTTLALALVSLDDKNIIKTLTKTNPQRVFGADVMSRIEYCRKNGVQELNKAMISAVNDAVSELLAEYNLPSVGTIYVSGNTTMLHLFFGVDCSAMGVSPYIPSFLESKCFMADELSVKNADTVISLPNISAFVGADVVAGMNLAGFPEEGKYNILIDLGTNAEVVLYSDNKILCTAAAAGPCFEGANISCGMSSVEGAVCSYVYGEEPKTIADKKAVGICATGLIDIIAELLKNGIIDETGHMDYEKYEISEDLFLTQGDIRQFQLAKSAVYSAVIALIEKASVTFRDIDKIYVSGGFSAKLNKANGIYTGLLPMEAANRYVMLNNSSLLGTIKFVLEKNDLSIFTEKAEYVDLAADKRFSELFIENMMFLFAS